MGKQAYRHRLQRPCHLGKRWATIVCWQGPSENHIHGRIEEGRHPSSMGRRTSADSRSPPHRGLLQARGHGQK
jgi:hypothetical protein